MGTVADKLNLLLNTKAAIRKAIIGKGQAIADTDPFSSYAAKIDAIQTGGSVPLDPVEVYNNTRPADWLPMPKPQDDEIYLLFHIPDGASSLLAFKTTCTGDYEVAVGTVENGAFAQSGEAASVASGLKYEAELSADDFGNLTSTGMKQCMVKVSGTDILTWEPSYHRKKLSPANFFGWNIVEIACRLPKGTKVACGGSSATRALNALRFFSWYGENNAADMREMFKYCSSLTVIPALDTSKATYMYYMFGYCYSLAAIPALDTSKVTYMYYMFGYCYSLTTIPELDTSKVTNMSYMFGYCYSLAAVPALDTSKAADMSYMFYKCSSLTAVPTLDTSNASDMYNAFTDCGFLAELTLNPAVSGWAGQAINLKNCSFCHQKLVDLFNSLPAIVVSKALTLTGNPGVSELTDEEKAIATGKNWGLTL